MSVMMTIYTYYEGNGFSETAGSVTKQLGLVLDLAHQCEDIGRSEHCFEECHGLGMVAKEGLHQRLLGL